MQRRGLVLLGLLALVPGAAMAASSWTEGKHYDVLKVVQRTTVPAGKVEVLEVFSYGCPACNGFQPIMDRLKANLPANAELAYLHASFNKAESWPMFQRAFLTAQALGIADRTHQAMFDAIWKSGELAVVNLQTGKIRSPQPALEDAARFYARVAGVKPETFLATAKSFSVETRVKASDAQVKAMQVPSTPCIVVNGRYRVNMQSVSSVDEFISIVKFLVAKETAAPAGAR
jgi:protein dithiol oxidoreductase (disulfide-forming)